MIFKSLKIFVWSFLSCLILHSLVASTPAGNIACNPGFEEDKNGLPENWSFFKKILEGTAEIDKSIFHSGKKSLHIKADRGVALDEGHIGSIGASTSITSPSPGTKLQVSVWIKAKDVVSPGKYYKLRVTVQFMDQNKKLLSKNDLFTMTGSCDWKKFSTELLVPENSVYMNFNCLLTNCTGEAWFDDIEITPLKTELNMTRTVLSELEPIDSVLIPNPWKGRLGNYKMDIGNLYLKTNPEDKKFNLALNAILNEKGVKIAGKNNPGKNINPVFLVSLDPEDKKGSEILKSIFPENTFSDIGKQGYFILTADLDLEKDNKLKGLLHKLIQGTDSFENIQFSRIIILYANSEAGRYYSAQTLAQLIKNENDRISLQSAAILDKPDLDKRGVVIGLQWFAGKDTAINRMKKLKFNLAWHQGSFLNGKFSFFRSNIPKAAWREPFTENELEILRNYLELCKNNFIEVWLSFGPRGIPYTSYSSDNDINILVDKMKTLYAVGFRNFGINFDDLGNIEQDKLFTQDDIEKFKNNIGKAHAYFVKNVYERLIASCPDVNFAVVPMAYQSLASMPQDEFDYIKELGNLPTGINIFVACLYSADDVRKSRDIYHRKPFIWDNYYARKLPAIPMPIDRPQDFDNNSLSGYMFLPEIPKNEDASGISWLNASDYEWAPTRYKPSESLKRAIAFIAEKKDAINFLKIYGSFSTRMENKDFAAETKEKRLADMKSALSDCEKIEKNSSVLPDKLSTSIKSDIEKYHKDLEMMISFLNRKPYPVMIEQRSSQRFELKSAMNDFISLKSDAVPEETIAWLSYDVNKLYLRIICKEPLMNQIVAQRLKKDEKVYLDDSIEIFIMPKPNDIGDDSTYYHMAFNSAGIAADEKCIYRKYNYINSVQTEWNGEYEIHASKEKDSWTLDIQIPFKTLAMTTPQKGQRIYLNICRNRCAGKKYELSTFSLLLNNKFHDPMSFWPAEFR